MAQVLVFEPSAERSALLIDQWNSSIFQFKIFNDLKELQKALEEDDSPTVLLDVDFLDGNDREILKQIENRCVPGTIIGLTTKTDVATLQLFVEHRLLFVPFGSFPFSNFPAVLKAIEELKENTLSSEKAQSDVTFIGQSAGIKDILEKIDFIAQSEVHILITGETGSGKTVLAKLIHNKSKRRKHPFLHINCAAIPEQLLEAELFGYKKGAFTGALRDTPGKFKAAGFGTILLDEIAEMPVHLQAKILRVLDEGLYFPVGSVKTESVHARIIAATNKDLEEEMAQKKFRKDLYYRLSTLEIHIPSLRQRKEDIPQLFDFYLDNYIKKYNIKKPDIQPNVYEVLRQYHWPGNIRELQNVVETIMYMKPQKITIEMLPQKLFGKISATLIKAASEQWTLDELKREYARYVFNLTNKNKSKSARILNVDIKTFKKLLKSV